MSKDVTVIIVTHNSEDYLGECLAKLRSQSHPPAEVVIADSGSENKEYLERFRANEEVKLVYCGDVGFSRANNQGFAERESSSEFVIFLNPDTFLSPDFIRGAIEKMGRLPHVGVLSGRLMGYDLKRRKGTGKLDSTGVFRKPYGRWYDRGQNENDFSQYFLEEEVPALCGALLFCRQEALACFEDNIFDPDFFLYKEDIELSLRLRKNSWKLLYSPELKAYHCRGWSNRAEIPYLQRKMAAESEILLYKKHPSPYILWALLKYFLVVSFRI